MTPPRKSFTNIKAVNRASSVPPPYASAEEVSKLAVARGFVLAKEKTTKMYPRGSFWVGVKEIGAGQCGTVYLIIRTTQQNGASSFPSRMANKTAPLQVSATLRWEKEVLSRYLTASTYVVKCYGDEITDGRYKGEKVYNLFLEFCSGGTLFDRISNSGDGLHECEVKWFTTNILLGLCYIHGNQIAHRDIKPENILLVPRSDCKYSYVAKISDFGLCKNLKTETEESKQIRGTVKYLAPEAVKHNMQSCPADIWALGCTIVEMMTNCQIWFDDSASTLDGISKLMDENLNGRPEIPEHVSEEGRDFLDKCFITNPRDRWTANMLLQHPFLKD